MGVVGRCAVTSQPTSKEAVRADPARPTTSPSELLQHRAGSVRVRANDDGTLDVQLGDRAFRGLCALEDLGDRGDSYDFDPVRGGTIEPRSVRVTRARHSNGIQELEIERTLRIPARLGDDRRRRSAETCELSVGLQARVAPGSERVDLRVRIENAARDHRLRMLLPQRNLRLLSHT